ncbi:MAG: DUF6273 domain-containing protein [Bacteroidales bacterium]|nr:DUF6273 domain-containing protein [Bacteroidales bacterium]
MKNKKNIIFIAVLVLAAAAVAAVVVLYTRLSGGAQGEAGTTGQTETAAPEPTVPEQTTPEETKPEIVNPKPYEPEEAAHIIDENNHVFFGMYPYSLTEDGISGLEAAEYDDDNITEIDGTRYMRVENGEGYDYYRFEMIKWDVIEDGANGYLLLASQAVDNMPYNDAFGEVTWEKSSLCAWLNGFFYETAFSEEERGGIVQTELGATRNPIYTNEAGEYLMTGEYLLTNIYLLCADELLKPDWGYDVYVQTEDPARICTQTPFAKARGVYEYSDGCCRWWTRTNGVETIYAIYVNDNGVIGCDGIFTNSDGIGVRPVVRVSKELLHRAAE